MGFGFAHITSHRRYQPSACSANATRHGMPIRFFSGNDGHLYYPPCERLDSLATTWVLTPARVLFAIGLSTFPAACVAYESPKFSQSVPSSLSTRLTSRNTATSLA